MSKAPHVAFQRSSGPALAPTIPLIRSHLLARADLVNCETYGDAMSV